MQGDASTEPSPGTLRGVLRGTDGVSIRNLLIVLIGFPAVRASGQWALQQRGLSETSAVFLADVLATLAIGIALYLESRRIHVLAEQDRMLRAQLEDLGTRYRRIAEVASDVVYAADADRRVTWVSPSVSRVLGWSPEEVVGRSIASFLHPDDRVATEDVRSRVYSGQTYETPSGGFLVRLMHRDHRYIWMSVRVQQILDEVGLPSQIVGGLTEVQELVEARQRAEEQEALGRLVADAMLDPQVLLRVVRDAQGAVIDFIFVRVNHAAGQYLEATEAQLIGSRLLEVSAQMHDSVLFRTFRDAVDAESPIEANDLPVPSFASGATAYCDVRARRTEGDGLAVIWRNVTAQRQIERQLAESESRFRLLAENSSDVIILTDPDLRIVWVSPSASTVIAWNPADLLGNTGADFVHPDDTARITAAVSESMGRGESTRLRYRWRRPDGSYLWVEAAGTPLPDAGGGQPGRLVLLRDVHSQVLAHDLLHRRATFDDLTGALQREAAFNRLAEIEHRPRAAGDATGVLFIDIDDFKDVNDGRGHAAGDAVLRAFAERARASVRGSDAVARMGGDEFLVILDGIGSLDRAQQVARKIHAACARPVPTPTGTVEVTVSIGVTIIAPGEDADTTIARADAAMYSAKSAGRNQIRVLPAP